jgi:hypothetical protein
VSWDISKNLSPLVFYSISHYNLKTLVLLLTSNLLFTSFYSLFPPSFLPPRVARGADTLGGLTAIPLFYQALLLQKTPGLAVCRLVQAALSLQRRTQQLQMTPEALEVLKGEEAAGQAQDVQQLCAR